MKQNELYERLRKDMYLIVRKEIEESMMMQKTLTLTDSQQMGGEAGMEDAAYCATTLHKSSCATLRLQLLVMMLYLIYLE